MAPPDAVPSSRPARLRLAGSLRIMSILPLTAARVEAHAAEMTTYLLLRSAPHGNRPWDRFLARVPAPAPPPAGTVHAARPAVPHPHRRRRARRAADAPRPHGRAPERLSGHGDG